MFMGNNVFIIGNGFDLDLGLKTKYSDFAKSKYWYSSSCDLSRYLDNTKDTAEWFDLENALLDYAMKETAKKNNVWENRSNVWGAKGQKITSAQTNMDFFEKLKSNLCDYLREEQDKELDTSAMANDVLKTVLQNNTFHSIYSFNYTDLKMFAQKLGYDDDFKYTHIHGKLANNSIILGVDETDLITGYEMLHKTVNPYYKSHNMFNDLLAAEEIIIYGLSFGTIDFTYFRQVFQIISDSELISEKNKKHITIFTKNETSRIEIMKRLSEMGINRLKLYAQSTFSIIKTEDGRNDEFDSFIKRIDMASIPSSSLRLI